jgi:hypothetical protein
MITKFVESIRLINSTRILEWKQYLKHKRGKHFEHSYPEIDFEQRHNPINEAFIFGEHISLYTFRCFQNWNIPILFEGKSLRIIDVIESQTILYIK